ncbi:MAG: T9SS type A sorting domain-containing protein [Bacteroidales bacterium]|nr:T9SS type A sorting domain-containing protein [Bacteroidales bacterium]
MKDFTSLEFTIENNNPVNISIFDIYGNHITTIENKTYSPGQYKTMWNGTDKNGKEVNPGTYLIRLKTGSQISTQRVVKIK